MQPIKVYFTLLLVAVATIVCVVGVDENSLQDAKCSGDPPESVQPDQAWLAKGGSFYLNAGSQLHLYRTAADVASTTVADVAPHDLFYNSCLRFVWGKETIDQGFGNKQSDCTLTPTDDGTLTFRYANIGLDGKASVVLTDNATFIMFHVCWPQGQEASWAVISTVPKLAPKHKHAVHKKAKELGFDEKQFSTLRFETCGQEEENETTAKTAEDVE